MTNKIALTSFISREIQRFTRVYVQSLISPWINAVLYIFIFGYVVGSRIDTIAGITYISFVLPGILMMNIISASFQQTAFSLYFKRFARYIEEYLVAPFSNFELLLGHVIGGVIRAIFVGVGIYGIAILFGTASIVHPFWFFFYSLAVATIFSLVGVFIGLWADSFEQLNILTTFVIMPFTYLGGMFNSVSMLPEKIQWFMRLNPFFYFVDGLRFSMTGVQESNMTVGIMLIFFFIVGLGTLVWYLFKIGWRIRN